VPDSILFYFSSSYFYKQCNLFTILNKQLMMMKQVLKYVMMLTLMVCSQWALAQGVKEKMGIKNDKKI